MADIFEISGRIHSTSQEEVVTTSSEILDEEKNKKQSEVNADVDTALADRYTKEETYSKSQLDNLITTPDVQYVTVATYSALPATGAADTIYRVASWDGSAVDAGKYSEYAWNGTAYQLLAVRSGSLDGVYDAISDISETIGGSLISHISLNARNKVIVASTGAISDNVEGVGISDYLSVTPGDTITIVSGVRQPANSSYAFCAFYSANTGAADTFISSQVNATTEVEITDREIKVPIGAHYMILYLNSYDTDAKIIYGKNIISSIDELKNKETSLEELSKKLVNYASHHNLTESDFVLNNQIYNSNSAITEYRADVKSTMLIHVVEGQKIYWHNWKHHTLGPEETTQPLVAIAAIYCYNDNGAPFNEQQDGARFNYGNLDSADYEAGEYSFTIPAGCTKVGFSNNLAGDYPVQTGANIDIKECYSLTDTSKEMIGDNVTADGNDSSKYYLKANSNIIYSPIKRLGIIAAGQSNIDGRDPYQEFPYLQEDDDNIHEEGGITELVYDNVRFKNAIGTGFQSFKIRKTVTSDPPVYDTQHPGYNWSFDAVVYRLLTNSSYGAQNNIYVMKKSMGGTSIDKDGSGGGGTNNCHWTADYEFLDSASDSLLRSFEGIIRSGVDEAGNSFDIKAFLWCQGEGDSNKQETADKYYTNLKNMFAYVRGIVGNPRLHIFCSNLSEMPRTGQPGHGFVTTINEAYDKIAAEDPYVHVVDMRNATYRFDHLHFDSAWSTYLGQKIYDMMIDAKIITGTKVNPTPPTNG